MSDGRVTDAMEIDLEIFNSANKLTLELRLALEYFTDQATFDVLHQLTITKHDTFTSIEILFPYE